MNTLNQLLFYKKSLFLDISESRQLGFQDPAIPVMEGIINFHHDLMFFLIIIVVFTSWIVLRCVFFFNLPIYSPAHTFMKFWSLPMGAQICLILVAGASVPLGCSGLDEVNEQLAVLAAESAPSSRGLVESINLQKYIQFELKQIKMDPNFLDWSRMQQQNGPSASSINLSLDLEEYNTQRINQFMKSQLPIYKNFENLQFDNQVDILNAYRFLYNNFAGIEYPHILKPYGPNNSLLVTDDGEYHEFQDLLLKQLKHFERFHIELESNASFESQLKVGFLKNFNVPISVTETQILQFLTQEDKRFIPIFNKLLFFFENGEKILTVHDERIQMNSLINLYSNSSSLIEPYFSKIHTYFDPPINQEPYVNLAYYSHIHTPISVTNSSNYNHYLKSLIECQRYTAADLNNFAYISKEEFKNNSVLLKIHNSSLINSAMDSSLNESLDSDTNSHQSSEDIFNMEE